MQLLHNRWLQMHCSELTRTIGLAHAPHYIKTANKNQCWDSARCHPAAPAIHLSDTAIHNTLGFRGTCRGAPPRRDSHTPTPIAEFTPVAEPAPIAEFAPVAEPTPIAEFAPVAEPLPTHDPATSLNQHCLRPCTAPVLARRTTPALAGARRPAPTLASRRARLAGRVSPGAFRRAPGS